MAENKHVPTTSQLAGTHQPISSSGDDRILPPRTEEPKNSKVLVVANRLPVTVHLQSDSGEFTVSQSSGGLVSALKGVSGIDTMWMGWPGTDIPPKLQARVLETCQTMGSYPVFLDAKTIDYFYNGFCNNILWPLYHYVPLPMDFGSMDTPQEEYLYYVKANEIFTDAVVKACRAYPSDDLPFVWVHDYHLMMLPRMLRERIPLLRIGWFLHTPWPTYEVFRMLPFRTEILTGLLSANLLAFHVYDYQRHFMQCCRNLLGLEAVGDKVIATSIGGNVVKCSAIPIGIEPMQYVNVMKTDDLKEQVARLRQDYGQGRKIILGVDRLDYMKGIPHKLNIFDRFLELYPDWRGKVVLIQLAVPTRSTVPEYQKLKSAVHEMVGRINGRRGMVHFVPVYYVDASLPFLQLCALYRIADICLITSLRDGMNLVAFEYVAAQKGKHGVLVLSEFAAVSQSLSAGAIKINPWNVDESANALKKALTMELAERKSRHDYCFHHVLGHTSQRWAETFLGTLGAACAEGEEARAAIPPILDEREFVQKFINADRRLVFIELIDALVRGKGQRGLAVKRFKSLVQIPEDVLTALRAITADSQTLLIISSAAPPQILDRLFGGLKAILAAGKGTSYRNLDGKWHDLVTAEQIAVETKEWMPAVQRVVQWMEKRTPSSYIEQAPASLTWHWDELQAEIGQTHARELLVHLWAGPLAQVPGDEVDVTLGPTTVEIRPTKYSREKMVRRITAEVCGQEKFDFVSALGTYRAADEGVYSVFEALASTEAADGEKPGINFFSVTVSVALSHAKFRMPSVEHVQALLTKCAQFMRGLPVATEDVSVPSLPPKSMQYGTQGSGATAESAGAAIDREKMSRTIEAKSGFDVLQKTLEFGSMDEVAQGFPEPRQSVLASFVYGTSTSMHAEKSSSPTAGNAQLKGKNEGHLRTDEEVAQAKSGNGNH